MHRQQDDGQDEHAAGGGAKILCQMVNGLPMPSARPQRLAAQRTARSLRAAITWSAMMDSTLNPRNARYPRRPARLTMQRLIVPPPLWPTFMGNGTLHRFRR